MVTELKNHHRADEIVIPKSSLAVTLSGLRSIGEAESEPTEEPHPPLFGFCKNSFMFSKKRKLYFVSFYVLINYKIQRCFTFFKKYLTI